MGLQTRSHWLLTPASLWLSVGASGWCGVCVPCGRRLVVREYDMCSKSGHCNLVTGQCECFTGYAGGGCAFLGLGRAVSLLRC